MFPCPGGGLCCNRPLFNRTMFPCKPEERLVVIERRLAALEAAVIAANRDASGKVSAPTQ